MNKYYLLCPIENERLKCKIEILKKVKQRIHEKELKVNFEINKLRKKRRSLFALNVKPRRIKEHSQR